jgi:hypothetical protein
LNDYSIPEFFDDSFQYLATDETVHQNSEFVIFLFLEMVYFCGVAVLGLRFVLFIRKLFSLIKKGALSRIGNTFFVATSQQVQPFSFFNYIFFNAEKAAGKNFETIVAHENVHVRQLHTVDLLLTEILVILFWFNPFVFLLRNAVRANHEFLADEAVVKHGVDSLEYMQILAVQATSNQFGGFGSHFKSSIVKNRFVMITKKRSSLIKSLKYVLILPLLGVLISAFSTNENSIETIVEPIVSDLPNIAQNDLTKEITFIQPVRDEDLIRMASGWGYRIHPIYKVKKFHYGIDYAAPFGSSILSIANGKINKIVNHGVDYKGNGYGNYVEIMHVNGFTSRYAQMSVINVKVGDTVEQGAIIGEVGNSGASTAPHLHFELHKDGKAVNPALYIKVGG